MIQALRDKLDKSLSIIYKNAIYNNVEEITKAMTTYAYKLTTLIQEPYYDIKVYSIEDDSIYIDVYLDKELNGYTMEVRNNIINLIPIKTEEILYSQEKIIPYAVLKQSLLKGNKCILEFFKIKRNHLEEYSLYEKKILMDYPLSIKNSFSKNMKHSAYMFLNQKNLNYQHRTLT